MRERAPATDIAGRLLVECWCGATTLWVWPQDLRAGHTGVCGAPDCHEPLAAA